MMNDSSKLKILCFYAFVSRFSSDIYTHDDICTIVFCIYQFTLKSNLRRIFVTMSTSTTRVGEKKVPIVRAGGGGGGSWAGRDTSASNNNTHTSYATASTNHGNNSYTTSNTSYSGGHSNIDGGGQSNNDSGDGGGGD
ncbi:hypothetical protein ABFS82_08G200500 [Erythranthe guttata]